MPWRLGRRGWLDAYGNVVGGTAALFAPLEIRLPDYTNDHHLTFDAGASYAWLYSEEGRPFERRYINWEAVLHTLVSGQQTADENRRVLQAIATRLGKQNPAAREIANRFSHPAIKASILAFLVLDVQLTFFTDDPSARRRRLWRRRMKSA